MRKTQVGLFDATVDEIEGSYLSIIAPSDLRRRGVTFTPQWIVDLMLELLACECPPAVTVIDAGAGAGRFSLAVAKALPRARVLAIESNPELALNLVNLIRTSSLAQRISVRVDDFLEAPLPADRPRIFIGNPPYVRHHTLRCDRKSWLAGAGATLGKAFSKLAGLHAYFLARCLIEAKSGDRLLMILPSEWMETRYGVDLKAAILERAGPIGLYVFPPGTEVFDRAMTTSVILDVKFNGQPWTLSAALIDPVAKRLGSDLKPIRLPGDAPERTNWLHAAWSATGCEEHDSRDLRGTVELGELFRVHRGQATGMNSIWVAGPQTESLIPARCLFPCVTDAKEILSLKNGVLKSPLALKRVIDLPADLDELSGQDRDRVARFLKIARHAGAADTYIARHRSPWWRVGLREAPAIVMSYMARQSPKFAVNGCYARLLNIAHGLYPKVQLSKAQLRGIVDWLNNTPLGRVGRTYAGGLIKVEPGDALRIRVPDPATLTRRLAA
jgi:hypothetical protein